MTMPESRSGWRGFHHVAVMTRDLEETAPFYGEILGMSVEDLIERDAQGTVSRHRFIRPGGDGS